VKLCIIDFSSSR